MTSGESAELRELRKRNKTKEKEVLQRAAAFFAPRDRPKMRDPLVLREHPAVSPQDAPAYLHHDLRAHFRSSPVPATSKPGVPTPPGALARDCGHLPAKLAVAIPVGGAAGPSGLGS